VFAKLYANGHVPACRRPRLEFPCGDAVPGRDDHQTFELGPFDRPCQCAAGHMMRQQPRSAARSPERRAASVVTFNVAEMMARRSEDRNARHRQQTFANGATLAELEEHLAFLRSLGAPGDAHPRVGVNDDYEITWLACVVERRTLDGSRQ